MSMKIGGPPDIKISACLDRTPYRKMASAPGHTCVIEEALALSAAVRVRWNREKRRLHEFVSFVGVVGGALVSPVGHRFWIALCHVAGIVQAPGLEKVRRKPCLLLCRKKFPHLRPRTITAHPRSPPHKPRHLDRSLQPQTYVISTGAKRSGETPVFAFCLERFVDASSPQLPPQKSLSSPQSHNSHIKNEIELLKIANEFPSIR